MGDFGPADIVRYYLLLRHVGLEDDVKNMQRRTQKRRGRITGAGSAKVLCPAPSQPMLHLLEAGPRQRDSDMLQAELGLLSNLSEAGPALDRLEEEPQPGASAEAIVGPPDAAPADAARRTCCDFLLFQSAKCAVVLSTVHPPLRH